MKLGRKKFVRFVALGGGAAAVALMFLGGAIGMGSGPTVDTFPGAPTAPKPLLLDPLLSNFDVQVHSRDSSTWYQLQSMTADHGTDCAAPPATHPETGNYADAVFQCANHLMTSINAGGYGEIVLTPNQLEDFSGGGYVQWDESTQRDSTRDWTDLWITPYSQNLTLPFDDGEVDQQGIPQSGVHIMMDQFNGETIFRVYTIKNYVETELNDCWWCTLPEQIAAGTNQAATRQTFKLSLSPTHIRFERLASATAKNTVWVDQAVPDLGFTQGVVQWAQHSYNPTKDNSGVPATWHWNNFTLSNGVPFSIIKATTRYADQSTPTVTFAQPANPNSMLRFSGIGTIQVSFDGGATWQTAQKQSSSTTVGANGASYHPEHQSPFFTPIPAGATKVQFRWSPDDWYTGPYIAQDFAIWSTSASGGAKSPTATATATPTKSATATASATQSSTATATTTAMATKTPSPSPTASPSPTSTSTPVAVGTWKTSASAGRARRGGSVAVTARVTSSIKATALVDVELYDPSGTRVGQVSWDRQAFSANLTRSFSTSFKLPANAKTGTWTVKVGVFNPGWAGMLSWTNSATTFVLK